MKRLKAIFFAMILGGIVGVLIILPVIGGPPQNPIGAFVLFGIIGALIGLLVPRDKL